MITIVFSMSIFPWAAHKWLGPDFWVWAIVLLAVIVAAVKMRMAAQPRPGSQGDDLVHCGTWDHGHRIPGDLYPWIMPGTWTIYSGASPAVSLFTFTLAMGGFFPVMIMYNAYQIWVFRGRLSALAVHH